MKRLVKVALVPGAVKKVEVEGNVSARELFRLAGFEVNDNMSINAGSTIITLDTIVTGDIVVASAKIKGNAQREVKVALVPGRVVKVMIRENVTARELFRLAGLEVNENMSINAGSTVVDLDTIITGDIVVASAKIKGNAAGDIYKVDDDFDSYDLELIGLEQIDKYSEYELVDDLDSVVIIEDLFKTTSEGITLDKEQFESIFIKKGSCFAIEELPTYEEEIRADAKEVEKPKHECKCGGMKEKIESMLRDEKEAVRMYERWILESKARIDLMESLLK